MGSASIPGFMISIVALANHVHLGAQIAPLEDVLALGQIHHPSACGGRRARRLEASLDLGHRLPSASVASVARFELESAGLEIERTSAPSGRVRLGRQCPLVNPQPVGASQLGSKLRTRPGTPPRAGSDSRSSIRPATIALMPTRLPESLELGQHSVESVERFRDVLPEEHRASQIDARSRFHRWPPAC